MLLICEVLLELFVTVLDGYNPEMNLFGRLRVVNDGANGDRYGLESVRKETNVNVRTGASLKFTREESEIGIAGAVIFGDVPARGENIFYAVRKRRF